MLDAKEKEVLAKAMRVNWVIWGAMVSSIGIYILVAHLTAGKIGIGAGVGDIFGLLRTVLLILGMGELLLIPVIKKQILKSSSPTLGRSVSTGPLTSQSHLAATIYTTALVVSLAIAESVAIYGLVLFFLGGDFRTLYIFAALGASGMIVARPKMDELEQLVMIMSKEKYPKK